MSANKTFFLKLALLLILALILNEALNLAYDRWMYYFRLARNQDEQFATVPDTLKYLMLGNSHNRVNPEILGNGFCYITPKESYRQTWYKLKYILTKTTKRPANVLLSIDPVNFGPKAETDRSFDGYWRKYLDYGELAMEHHDPGYLLNWVSGTFFSYVGNYKYSFMSLLFFNADMKKIKYGYFPARNYKNFAREPNRDQLGYFVASAYLAGYVGRSVICENEYYRRILALCRQYRIHLILLRMPLTDEYLKYARKIVNLDKLDRQIVEFTGRYSTDFEVFDFRNEFHGRPDYFFNADHINPAGAAIISNKIKDEIERKKR